MRFYKRSEKIFLLHFFSLAFPVALQNLITSLLNTLDTLMIGSLGEASIAGVGLATKAFFLYQLITFGLFSGASVFTAQYWGKRDIGGIRTVSLIQLVSVTAIGLCFFIPCFLFPDFILTLFTKDPEVVTIGADYLRTVSLGFIPSGLSVGYYFLLRATQNALPCVYISSISVLLDGVLSFILIFGMFGAPRLGVAGAAVGTVIARFAEFFMVLLFVRKRFAIFRITKDTVKSVTKEYLKKFLSSALPVVGNESLWSLGVVLYAVIFARIGTEAVASTSIATSIETLLNVFFFGVASASGIIIGKKIGQRKESLAIKYAYRLSVFVPVLSILFAAFGILLAPYVLNLYNITPVTKADAYLVFVLICLFLPFRNFNLVNIVGSLRNGGDTKFCLFIDLGGVWLIALPGALISGLVFDMNIGWVYFFILLEEIVKAFAVVLRLRSKIWVNNLVH